jgi:hypothetical protein
MRGARAAFDYNVALGKPTQDLSTLPHVGAREESLAVVPPRVAMWKDVKDATMPVRPRPRTKETTTDDFPNSTNTAREEDQAFDASQQGPNRLARDFSLGVPEGSAPDDPDTRAYR